MVVALSAKLKKLLRNMKGGRWVGAKSSPGGSFFSPGVGWQEWRLRMEPTAIYSYNYNSSFFLNAPKSGCGAWMDPTFALNDNRVLLKDSTGQKFDVKTCSHAFLCAISPNHTNCS